MEDAHAKEISEVVERFGVEPTQGLTDGQVVTARGLYGLNELAPDEGTPLWKLILKQFDDLLVKILIAAAVVDLMIALASGETGVDAFVEPGVIMLILLANATVGVVTENNAEKAIESLKAYEADAATVLRHGHLTLLPAAELVPGDIVEVTVGGKVPADMRVMELLTTSLRVDQSILTGESGSVSKDTDAVRTRKAVYQDMTNILFSGTVVTAGRARGIVIGTGPYTAIGKIRDAMAEAEEEMTPLKRKLDEFGTFLSKVIAVICVLVWVVNIPHFKDALHGGWVMGALYYFKIAVALAVAAIPEGLPAVVTTCLALGTRQMAKHNAIVRSLPSVETLGCTSVVCSDKTGTLTTNQMSVARVAVMTSRSPSLSQYAVTGTTYSPDGELLSPVTGQALSMPGSQPSLLALARCSSLCNDSTLYYDPLMDAQQSVGESTEVALRVLAEKIGVPGVSDTGVAVLTKQQRFSLCNDYWQTSNARRSILEFSRDRKMMSTLHTGNDGLTVMYTKGAPEQVLNRCSNVMVDDGGTSVPLTPDRRLAVRDMVESWGSTEALRCLALAYKNMPASQTQLSLADEHGLTLIGVVGIHDPPRKEVAAAIDICRGAGIRVIVITGDNQATAEAVCHQIGMPVQHKGARQSITGAEFDDLDALDQETLIDSLVVLARVEPSHKSRMVELLKKHGNVVAMTGDGVNDAPALRRADIGIAMGSGTAVAKHAADMVLADDNFATIVKAVEQGRCIYANTKQFIRYMVSSNIGEVVAIFSAAIVGMPETLNPVQLLWVNLVTDGLPATALGFNKPDPNIMKQKPRSPQEGIVDRWLFIRYLVIGFYVGVVTVLGFVWWYISFEDGPQLTWRQLTSFVKCTEGEQPYSCAIFSDKRPSTISMSVLVVVEMFNALNALSENESLLRVPFWSNPWLLGAITMSMLLHFTILYVPWLATMFSVTALTWQEWKVVLLLSFPVILVDEALKWFSRVFVLPGRVTVLLPSWLLRRKYQVVPAEEDA